MNLIGSINQWLKVHPYWAGALAAAEGAVAGVLVDAMGNPQSLTKAGLHQTLITIAGAMAIALRNYFKEAPRTEWSPSERAAKASAANTDSSNSAAAGKG